MATLPISGNLAEFDVATILAAMNCQEQDGQLNISTAAFCKKLRIENHRITFAQSNLPEDSFGCFLLRRKIIDSAMLEKSRTYKHKHKIRHGRALLEMGHLNPEQLWTEVSAHLRAIIFSLFPLTSGQYDIGAQTKNKSENIALDMPIPEAILEGARQIQDQPFIESKFSENMALFPAASPNFFPPALKPFEAHVLSLVAEGSSLAEIIVKSELLRLDTLKILYGLLKLGYICDCRQPVRQPTPNSTHYFPTTFTSFEGILQYYNSKFEYIYRVLSKEIGPVAQSILFEAITTIIESIPACFHNLKITAEGRVEEKSILKNTWYENFEEHNKEFLKGLEEILYAEIYAVKRHLGKEHEKLILQWIREPGN